MTVGGLFEGIGGFPLAAQWAGLTPVWSNEIDPFCCQVLRKNFKHRIIEDDIRSIGKQNLEPVDILTGGFPCQPYSSAGKREGTEDPRHLWPEMLRVIGEIQPAIVVGENVYGLLNWSGGLVFNQVQTDLENLGYSVTPFVLPACGVNAPQRRDRVWFIAHCPGVLSKRTFKEVKGTKNGHEINGGNSGVWASTNNNNKGLQGGKIDRSAGKIGPKPRELATGLLQPAWQDFPTQPPVCGGNDGIPNRVDRIKSLGNAIVPQIAFEIFKAIKEVNKTVL